VCFSTHQLPDLVLADRRVFRWPEAVESFTHVCMLIGLSPLYAQLNLLMLMRSAHFKDVVALALLVKMTKVKTRLKSSVDINTADEQSMSDKIK